MMRRWEERGGAAARSFLSHHEAERVPQPRRLEGNHALRRVGGRVPARRGAEGGEEVVRGER